MQNSNEKSKERTNTHCGVNHYPFKENKLCPCKCHTFSPQTTSQIPLDRDERECKCPFVNYQAGALGNTSEVNNITKMHTDNCPVFKELIKNRKCKENGNWIKLEDVVDLINNTN